MKDYSDKECVICGYNIVTQEHHPDKKVKMSVVYKAGIEILSVQFDLEYHEKLIRSNKGEHVTVNQEDRYPSDNKIFLCLNCHWLFHRTKMSYREIKEKYLISKLWEVMEYKILSSLPFELLELSEKPSVTSVR